MTIGVGFGGTSCNVLGSDMELSGVAKYKKAKDYFGSFNRGAGVVAAVYSGIEDDMRCVWEELEDRLEARKSGTPLSVRSVRAILAESLTAVITDRKSKFQMLVVISNLGEKPKFLRVFGKRLTPARDWEIIGVGDCELTRYLTSQMDNPNLTVYQAALWTSYVINVASSFVRDVGQGIRLTVMNSNPNIQYFDGKIFADRLDDIDRFIRAIWSDFCNAEMDENEFRTRVSSHADNISRLRGRIPLVIRP